MAPPGAESAYANGVDEDERPPGVSDDEGPPGASQTEHAQADPDAEPGAPGEAPEPPPPPKKEPTVIHVPLKIPEGARKKQVDSLTSDSFFHPPNLYNLPLCCLLSDEGRSGYSILNLASLGQPGLKLEVVPFMPMPLTNIEVVLPSLLSIYSVGKQLRRCLDACLATVGT